MKPADANSFSAGRRHDGLQERPAGASERACCRDAGKGFDPAKPLRDTSGGFGLFHIRERLDHAGGRLDIQSKPGRGTRIVLLAPLAKNAPEGREESHDDQGAHR
jgi:signal transduction histidine kinase